MYCGTVLKRKEYDQIASVMIIQDKEMKKTTVEKVFALLDKTLFKIICKTDEEREAMKRYLLAVMATL